MISIKELIGFDDSKCAVKMKDVDYIAVNEWDKGGCIVGVVLPKNPMTDDERCEAVSRAIGCKVTIKK